LKKSSGFVVVVFHQSSLLFLGKKIWFVMFQMLFILGSGVVGSKQPWELLATCSLTERSRAPRTCLSQVLPQQDFLRWQAATYPSILSGFLFKEER
jgi:hypothetical protein